MTGPARETRRDLLWDLAVANPNGITVDDMVDVLGFTHPQANQAIRDLRVLLGDHDSINFPCKPDPADPQKGRWLYQLVGTLDEIRWWSKNRIVDTETRVRTQAAMVASIVEATDGRSAEGRKARTMEKSLRRLVEDLDDIDASFAPPTLFPPGATKQQIAGHKAAATRRANDTNN